MVRRATCLDDGLSMAVTHMEHHGVDQSPTEVRNDLRVDEPAGQESLLARRQQAIADHASTMT
jgi:hypothetical protein